MTHELNVMDYILWSAELSSSTVNPHWLLPEQNLSDKAEAANSRQAISSWPQAPGCDLKRTSESTLP